MWTKVFLFLWIIVTVIYKSTPILTDCANRVQRCPLQTDQWAQKKDLLKCTASFGYVCLRDANGYLYESCMANFTILADSGNCPTLSACQDNKPYLGTHTTYYHCPGDVSGCPPRNHAEYSIHQLYKYPKCIESNFSEEMESTSQTSTTSMASKESSDLNRLETKGVVIPLVITLVLAALLGCFIGYIVYSRKKKYGYSKGTSEDTESPSEDIVYSRKKKYGYSKGTSENTEGPSEDGCPFITKAQGKIKIHQKECIGNISGCPEGINDTQFLSSELYKFPSCLSIPVKRTTTEELPTKNNIIYDFAEVTESRTITQFDSGTTNGGIADMEVLFLTYQMILFGVGLYVLICVLTGYIAFNLYKRIKELRVRLEADICMSADPFNASMTQPQHESENEATYDSVYNEVEGSES